MSLPPPKKLKNPFARFEQQQTETVNPPAPVGGPKKLTWSERRALANKEAKEEEARSRAAGFHASTAASKSVSPTPATVPQSTFSNFGAVRTAAGATGTAATPVASEPFDRYASARDVVQDAAWGTDEPEEVTHVSFHIQVLQLVIT